MFSTIITKMMQIKCTFISVHSRPVITNSVEEKTKCLDQKVSDVA